MTVLLDDAETTSVAGRADSEVLARWHIRAAALAVDVLPGLAVVVTFALVSFAVPMRSPWWWVSISVAVAVALLTWANRTIVPAALRWSLGRALFGIALQRNDGTAVGLLRLTLRELAHLLDTLSVGVGWLWPLWDSRRRTFADMLTGTEVRRAERERPPGIRRRAVTAIGVAVSLCVCGAAISMFAIYLPDRAADRTRNEVTGAGPKIVTELLTYDSRSLQQDFARAQALTTDKYRPELVKQQESVRKGHAQVNEYWVTNSTVLSAARNSATMLLFMQGHRGGEQDRFITATVRVSLVRGGGGWLVDNLDVVTKPRPAPAPPAPTPPAPKGGK